MKGKYLLGLFIIGIILIGGCVQKEPKKEPIKEIGLTENLINTTIEFFKIKSREVTISPSMLGPASRYGCEKISDCAYILKKGRYDLPENDCGNLAYYGIVSGQSVASESIGEKGGGIICPEGEIMESSIDIQTGKESYKCSGDVIIDSSIACECIQHKAKPTEVSINIKTGEEEVMWIEDNFDYTICKKIEENIPIPIQLPDLKISNFYAPATIKTNEYVPFDLLIENIGTKGCEEVGVWIDFDDNDNNVYIKMSFCGHYYPPEFCREACPNPPCPVYFEPGSSFNLSRFAERVYMYTSSGTYHPKIYASCGIGEGDLDWSNNGPLTTTVDAS